MVLFKSDIKKMKEVCDYVEANLDQVLDAESLGKEFGISVSKLRKQFLHLYGETLFSYIHRNRMKYAYSLLESKSFNVSEVAVKVGYQDRTSFTHAFTKHFLKTPQHVLTSPRISEG